MLEGKRKEKEKAGGRCEAKRAVKVTKNRGGKSCAGLSSNPDCSVIAHLATTTTSEPACCTNHSWPKLRRSRFQLWADGCCVALRVIVYKPKHQFKSAEAGRSRIIPPTEALSAAMDTNANTAKFPHSTSEPTARTAVHAAESQSAPLQASYSDTSQRIQL